jgi:DNA-binding transcriptional regulator LsrR (DeoR family)
LISAIAVYQELHSFVVTPRRTPAGPRKRQVGKASIPERDRAIVIMRFFGDMTQTQIGQQLGISQMHVSRLLSRSLEQLRVGSLDRDPTR